MSALDGIRVVELAGAPIAWAGKLLADMGADVILVEPPGGDSSRGFPPFLDDEPHPERSLHFWHHHTSKRSVVCDLGDPTDRDRLLTLIDSADVLLEAELPGRLADLGMDYDVLSRTNPGLVHVAVTSYGRNEPASRLPATDLTLMAAGGPPWSCGYDDHGLPPVRGWGDQAYHTASHFAVMSALTALLHRGAGGTGQFVDVSITAALNVTTEAASYTWLVNGGTVQRQTGRHAAIKPTGETQMRCADGRWVNTGVPPRFPAEFGRLLAWLEKLGLKEDFPEAVFLEMGAAWEGPFDLSQIGKDETITAIFSSGREGLQLIASRISAYDFFIGCQEAGLAVGVIYSPEEVFEDPHFVARGYPTEVHHEDLDRTFRYPGAPYRFTGTPWAIARRPPKLGEHTEEVFGRL
ncbi:MAG: CaiB/BaiF CoA transferase family protein [Pseudomonadales bacterium]